MVNPQKVLGVILAGGQSSRYGTNKAFVPLAGISLIERLIARAAPQVAGLLISAGDDVRFAALGLPLVRDELRERDGRPAGPLAGVLAALDWMAESAPDARWLATLSVDTPLVPMDMVARLQDAAARDGAEIACSRSAGRLHPLLALWSSEVREPLRTALAAGERAAHRFAQQRRLAVVDFAAEPFDPFANVNTPAELDQLARHLEASRRRR